MKSTPKDKAPKHLSHSDARVVMVRPMVVTAGGSMSHAPIQAARLVMAGNPKPIIEGLPGYVPIVVRLDWPDMSIPDMTRADWQWLSGRLRALRRPLHVSCAMGHGRTGTCLAILAHFWGQIPRKADPVQWVRDAYCQDAIETVSQIAYIERMTGRTVKAKAMPPTMISGAVGSTVSYEPDFPMGDYGKPYGAPTRVSGKVAYSDKPFESFPNNQASKDAASRALATGKWQTPAPSSYAPHGYCDMRVNGVLCPKPARADANLCDVHFFDSLPPSPGLSAVGGA